MLQINSTSYERETAVIACRRFRGTHSYDKIAELLSVVYERYGLSKTKLLTVTTDNAANFKKAFRELGYTIESEYT